MPDRNKQTEFEQKLIQLKQARDRDEISIDQYIEQAQNLRFDDESEEQTWLLDAETESWWVTPLGTEDFEEYVPPKPSAPPENDAESSPEPETETEAENKPEVVSPPPDTSSEPEVAAKPPGSENESDERGDKNSKYFLWGIAAVLVLLLGAGTIWFLFLRDDRPSVSIEITPSTEAPIQATATPMTTPSSTPVPPTTSTATPEPIPTATPSPLPPATATSVSTATLTPTQLPPAPDTPTSIPTQTPTFTPLPELMGKIAYPEFDLATNTFNVNVFDLAGNQLIKTIPQASQPALSSDGEKLAFISWAPDNPGLFSISLADEVRNVISTSREGQRAQWSFDNQAAVFEYVKEEQQDIRFSDNDGVPNIQKGLTPTWSPDGRLVIRVCQNTKCGLAVANTNGTDLRFLTGNTADISPAVSPDGQWVAYSSEQDGNWDVWLISMAGGTPTCLTNSPERDGIPTWSPNGQWIAFVSETGGQWTIEVIHPDGTGQQKLLDISNTLDAKVTQEEYRQLGWLHESISWSE